MFRIKLGLAVVAATALLPNLAFAEDVTYELAAGGVSCAGSAARAEMAVRSAGEVDAVAADPSSHSVTATFDDGDVTLASIVDSLEDAGFSVGEPVKLQ